MDVEQKPESCDEETLTNTGDLSCLSRIQSKVEKDARRAGAPEDDRFTGCDKSFNYHQLQ